MGGSKKISLSRTCGSHESSLEKWEKRPGEPYGSKGALQMCHLCGQNAIPAHCKANGSGISYWAAYSKTTNIPKIRLESSVRVFVLKGKQ